MRHMDLFSGIGGMSLALRGFSETVLYCDICPLARAVLSHRMATGQLDTAPVVHDIRHLTQPPAVDCITAGFPCTGFSISGLRQGFANEASGMFYELVRVCAEVQPQIVFMENTPWISKPANMRQVQDAFTGIGSYELRWCLLPAYAVGLPQNRLRWFCIAHRCSPESLAALQRRMGPLGVELPATPVPRTTELEDPCAYKRFALLRNAVVPQCARLAFHHLLDPGQAPLPKLIRPDLGLVMTDGVVTVRKSLWPTLHGHYTRKASRLTRRCCGDIGTALMYEAATGPGHINIRFLEALMGYAPDWTNVQFGLSPPQV